MAYPTPLNPVRVNPGDDGWKELMQSWYDAGKPRRVDALGIVWMQITDNEGICFVPQRPSGNMEFYEQSSYGKINR